ncbi:LysR family transcriptional regulator [Vibrio sp. SCSIO 43136]|uniref:LysR family transcriptional regulator n=1 Tax=Vibrio sp. SCSIO 43136 TaxID=2819101 RepID=UPI0020752D6F|nr:LysR family transcriptional regulator [Vibrio sp. SCSIO 43136]USD67179.1 LysR family transcriptional regulator [Vibrio sp. SCSIO 43136]
MDLKSIQTLVKLYDLGSVKDVAQSEGKTSSSVSKTITKLKQQLNDPLFVLNQQRFEPTNFLQQNISHFRDILASFDKVGEQSFEPSECFGPIVIYAQSHFYEVYGDELYQALHAQAPNATIRFNSWSNASRNKLQEGEGDIAIHVQEDELPQAIQQTTVAKRELGFLVRQDHPAQDIKDLVNYPVMVLHTPGWNDKRYHMLERLQSIGLDYHINLVIEQHSLRNKILLNGDHCSMAPSNHVPEGLKMIPIPNNLALELNFVVSYRRSQRDNPKIIWLKKVAKSILEKRH